MKSPLHSWAYVGAFAAIYLGSVVRVSATDWPMFGRNSTRNAVSPEKSPPADWQLGQLDATTGRWIKGSGRNIKWVARLGSMTCGDVEYVADQKVNVLVCWAGAQRIELVEPAAPDSPVSAFLEKRGGGLHHLAYRVDDVAAAIAALERGGVRMIDSAPRPGAHGTRIAFVHPKSTGGVLTELVEEPAAHATEPHA